MWNGFKGLVRPLSADPRFKKIKKISGGIAGSQIRQLPLFGLFDIHDELMLLHRSGEPLPLLQKGEASLLDLKIEIARHLLKFCSLCRRLCWVDRTRGELGYCRLGVSGRVTDISPGAAGEDTLMLHLDGCGWRCRSCLNKPPSSRERSAAFPLNHRLFYRTTLRNARFLAFGGGHPDNSLLAILEFLKTAPQDWPLPILWIGHSHTASPVLSLLEGIVDGYQTEFNYTCEVCGKDFSFGSQFPKAARLVNAKAWEQRVPVNPDGNLFKPRSAYPITLPGRPADCFLRRHETLRI